MRTLAIYPGSFDPVTLGHVDVIERASKLFDHLLVAVGENSAKRPLLSTSQRIDAMKAATADIPNVSVDSFRGLLMDFVELKGAGVIVRGLRATADFEYEFQMATINRKQAKIDTIFLMTKWEHSYLSSTMVKELARLGGEFETMVPLSAVEIIKEALNPAI